MREPFPYRTVLFSDESGAEGTYRYTGDWVEICDRAEKRLGLKADPDEPLRWGRARAAAKSAMAKGGK